MLLQRKCRGVEVEYIVVDGLSSDNTLKILDRYINEITYVISEKDSGPANAINKGLRLASGEVVSWLNADDRYLPGAFKRVKNIMESRKNCALCFGPCRIIDENGREIRSAISFFKKMFFPLSSQFMIQCLNYVSQPATFFRRNRLDIDSLLSEKLIAAWDYDFVLRTWQHGGGVRIKGSPVADFRWHPKSISARQFKRQFQEEFYIAAKDAGYLSPQTMIHAAVRWGIVAIYSLMTTRGGQQLANRR